MKKQRDFLKMLGAFMTTIAVLGTSISLPQNIFAADETLQSSNTLYHDISYEEELQEAVQVLSLGDITNVTSKLVLPYSYGIHINIDWKSSDESIIDLKGNVTTPTDADKNITLTATLTSTKLDLVETKEFVVHVPKASVEDILNQDAKEASEYIDHIINNQYVLPDTKELGIRSTVTWELVEGDAIIKEGKILKTSSSIERQPIKLKGTLTYENSQKMIELNNITLLDEYTGYILSYFAGKKESKEMYIGYSYDGIHWMRLNNADAVLSPKKGLKQIRDPFITRKKDGSFAIFATNGWTSPMITIWDSENLQTFENERLCQLSEKDGVASGFHTWAPECNYDPLTDQYFVYWSDPEANGGIGQTYYNTSTDLQNFSSADVFFEREFLIIDASIKKYKGDYYMVYDDATGDNDTGNGGRRIYAAKADSLKAGAFHPYSGVLSEGVAEGPFLFQDFKTGSWLTYYDYYSQHKFGVTTTEDLTTDNWVYKGISTTMPWEEVRHGGVIPVTQAELEKVLETWGKESPELYSITTPEAVTTNVGTDISKLKLPTTISATLSDGNVVTLPVEWDSKDISLEKEGTLTLTGTLKKSDVTFINEANVTPQIALKIEAATSISWLLPVIIIVVLILLIVTILLVRSRRKTANL